MRRPRTLPLPGPVLLALSALASCGGGAAEGAAVRNAVLITLDTTRRDVLGCYGGPPGLTPNLDALAAEARVYDAARTTAPITLPAHASMLTGLVPPRHGVRDNSLMRLPDAATTLAERASARGFQTAAFVAARVLDRSYGLDQGFDVYEQPSAEEHTSERLYGERPAAEIARDAAAWLAARDRDRPFLLWVHVFDPHMPYEPPPEDLRRAGGHPYRGEVAAMDAGLGILLDALRDDPAWDETAVLVVADHGEALGEHREATHSAFVYDGTIRVPFLLRLPGDERAGGRSDEPVSVCDVYPTLVEALELGPVGDVDGQSLLGPPIEPERATYFESYYGWLYYQWSPLAGAADARWKYVHASEPELYAWRDDPAETRDLAPDEGDPPDAADDLRRAIARLAARPRLEAEAEEGMDPALAAELEKLGYAGAGAGEREIPEPLEPSALPSPHSRPEELLAIFLGWELAQKGQSERAVELWRQVLDQNPRNHDVWRNVGIHLGRLERWDESLEALDRCLAVGPDWAIVHHHRGRALEALGRTEEALDAYRRAVAGNPRLAASLERLAALHEERGETLEAARWRTRWARAMAGVR